MHTTLNDLELGELQYEDLFKPEELNGYGYYEWDFIDESESLANLLICSGLEIKEAKRTIKYSTTN